MTAGGWACDRCGFARPERAAWLEGADLVLADGSGRPILIGLPGQFNRANAAMVAAVAARPGGRLGHAAARPDRRRGGRRALGRLAAVDRGGRRFSTMVRHGRSGPAAAGQEPGRVDGHLRPAGRGRRSPALPVVLSVNARTADGFDTSWLWDVPFERLAGRVGGGDR